MIEWYVDVRRREKLRFLAWGTVGMSVNLINNVTL